MNKSLCEYTTFCLSIHPSMDTWTASVFQLMWIRLLFTWMFGKVHGTWRFGDLVSILWGIYPEVQLVDHKVKVLVAQSCLRLCNSMDCSPPGSSVHGIVQARILAWLAIPFSRGSSQPRDLTGLSHIAGRFFTIWAAKEAQRYIHRKEN